MCGCRSATREKGVRSVQSERAAQF
jgi:hypothetical protein